MLYKTLPDIKGASKSGIYLANMLNAMFRDLSTIKPGKWEDLQMVLDQVMWLSEVLARIT